MIDVLLIYPKLGSMDSMVVDLPLSVLYAAADTVKSGARVVCLDLRLSGPKWEKHVTKVFEKEKVLLAGVSVMTGEPLRNARAVSQIIRRISPETRIVWGGPHGTVVPETLKEDFIDFLVRGSGSRPLCQLVALLKSDSNNPQNIPGLSYKDALGLHHNPRTPEHEHIHYLDIPYQLINVMDSRYQRQYSGKRVFPIFGSIGCPYRCSFCVHPAIYKEINGPKWIPLPVTEVVDHIEYIHRHYKAEHIVFMDDTAFPRLKRMQDIFNELLTRQLSLTLEFRGARVNEIMSMTDDFLSLMVKAGTRVLMVGVESGSDRILDFFQKGIKRNQVLEINRKLAKYQKITPHYNFIYGCPGETLQDLLETKKLINQLLHENPAAYFGFGSDWKPIPGTRLIDEAKKHPDFAMPSTIDDWIAIDSSDAITKIRHPWYSDAQNSMIKALQLASFVIDDKILHETAGNNSLRFRLMRMLAYIYKPVAKFRLHFNFYYAMLEYNLWRRILRHLAMNQYPSHEDLNK